MRGDHETEAFDEQNPDRILFESPPVWLLRKHGKSIKCGCILHCWIKKTL